MRQATIRGHAAAAVTAAMLVTTGGMGIAAAAMPTTTMAGEVAGADALSGLTLLIGGEAMGDFDCGGEGYARDFGVLDAPRPMTVMLGGIPEGWSCASQSSSRCEVDEATGTAAYAIAANISLASPDGGVTKGYVVQASYALGAEAREAQVDPGTASALDGTTLLFGGEEVPGFVPGQEACSCECGVGRGDGSVELRGLPEGWHTEVTGVSDFLDENEVDEEGNRYMRRHVSYSVRATSDDLMWSTPEFRLDVAEGRVPMPDEELTAPYEEIPAELQAPQVDGSQPLAETGKGNLAQTGTVAVDDSPIFVVAAIAAGSLAVTLFARHKMRNV